MPERATTSTHSPNLVSNSHKTYDLSNPIVTLPNGLAIRQLRHSDAPALSKHASNFRLARNMSNKWPHPYTVDQAHDWIAKCRDQSTWHAGGPTDPQSNNSAGLGQKLPNAWAITMNDEQIGSVGCQFEGDIHSRKMMLGYWLSEDYWRKGIMRTVLSAFIEWIWETFPWLVRLEAQAYSWNAASAGLLKKCGFEHEGTTRCSIERLGVIGDVLIFGLVRDGVKASDTAPELV